MKNRRDTILWMSLFALLIILSLDYWWWGAVTRLGPLGLPSWVFYFALLQIALAAGLYFFSKHHWDGSPSDDDGDDGEGPQ
jgi:hypothetical protein